LTGITMGGMIGSGIYVMIGQVTGYSGPIMWLLFLGSLFYCITEAMVYVEMACMYPNAASTFIYLREGLGAVSPAFAKMYSFAMVWATLLPLGTATLAMSGAAYVNAFIPVPIVPTAVGLVIICEVMSYIGIGESKNLGNIMTAIELGGVIMVIIIGAIWGKDQGNNYFMWPVQGLNGVILSLNLLFFTYAGYEGIGVWSEETIDPEKTIPRAALLAILIVGTVYTLMALMILRLDTWQNIGASGAPVVTAVVATLGPSMRLVFSFIGFCSIFNTLLFGIVGTATRYYAYAREGIFPKFLLKLDARTHRPIYAILLNTVAAIGVQFIGSIAFVSQAGTLAGTFNTGVVCIGLMLLRWKKPDMKRPYKVPGPHSIVNFMVVFCGVISWGVVGLLNVAYWVPYFGMYGSGAIIYWFLVRPREGKF